MADAPVDSHGEHTEFHQERGVFHAEYEQELGQWLRRRLGWLCIAYTVFQIIGTASLVLTTFLAGEALRAKQAEAAQTRAAISSPIDAVGEIARDIAAEVGPETGTKDAAPRQPIGRMVDSKSRRGIITVGIVVWSLFTAACGLATKFWHLFLARIGVGIGEAALSPAAYSLVADYFPPNRMGTAFPSCLMVSVQEPRNW